MKKSAIDDAVQAASTQETLEEDAKLMQLDRAQALALPAAMRLRWFYLCQVSHKNLKEVFTNLKELLEPTNEVGIVSLIGMTGIGKTTLARHVVPQLLKVYGAAPEHEVPIIYVKVPANGDRSVSWAALFNCVERAAHHDGGLSSSFVLDANAKDEMRYSLRKSRTLWKLREALEPLLVHRNVKVLILDEAAHLLRFQNYAAIMDTLKSLSDIGNVKLLLIGGYDIVDLVSNYGQVTRRGEIVHYKRYECGPPPIEGKKPTDDQVEFQKLLRRFEELWPSENVPNFQAVWYQWMRQSLGSVGLLKLTLLRLAALQLRAKGEKLDVSMLKKVFKTPKAIQQMETEAIEGEEKLKGTCYGSCAFSDAELLAMHNHLNNIKAQDESAALA